MIGKDSDSEQLIVFVIPSLPTEILNYIFNLISLKELMKCRLVCHYWNDIIERCFSCEEKWRIYCHREFSDVYLKAKANAKPELTWSDIYKSLSLWSKISSASATMDEFAAASRPHEEIINIIALSENIICVHTITGFSYYNLSTMRPTNDSRYKTKLGRYIKISQHTNSIVTLNDNMTLSIEIPEPSTVANNPTTFHHVTDFLHVNENLLFFLSVDNKIHMCTIAEYNVDHKVLFNAPETIICMSYKEKLHVLTLHYNIFTYSTHLQFTCTLKRDIMSTLHKYNLLGVEPQYLMSWMKSTLKMVIPPGPLQEMSVIHTYNNMVFVGTNCGYLFLYNVTDLVDIFQATPVKLWNFSEPVTCPVSVPSILQIAVVEDSYSHFVVVAMPKKVVVITLKHEFPLKSNYALLPYYVAHKYKINL